jgi:hypothetical protein
MELNSFLVRSYNCYETCINIICLYFKRQEAELLKNVDLAERVVKLISQKEWQN